jgi:hypothetical protein
VLWLLCPQCNYKKQLTETRTPIPEKQVDLPKDGIITVVDEKEDLNNLPTIRFDFSFIHFTSLESMHYFSICLFI